MKKIIIALLVILFAASACTFHFVAKNNSQNLVITTPAQNVAATPSPAPATPQPTQQPAPAQNVAEDNGIRIELVTVHPITGTDGKPYGVLEAVFTNNNSEGASFATNTMRTIYQGGIQCVSSSFSLPDSFDWDTDMTKVKDGHSITVYVPFPLYNTSDPVEVEVSIMGSDFFNLKTAKATFSIE